MNVDLLIKENQELSEEKQRYKEMWITANNSLAKYRKLEKEIGCPLEVVFKALKKDIIYYENNNGYLYEVRGISLKYLNEMCLTNGERYPKVKDYQKTWWLKEDRSE